MPLHVITDVGSTTTKAILIGQKDGETRMLGRGEAPTTVEKPYEDVTVGVERAVRRLEDVVGLQLLDAVKSGSSDDFGYLSTSSAGGGLQILVFGLTRGVTAESAHRAALGGGAIILDIMATDDGRPNFLKLDLIRESRPDMILISGGLDGGNFEFALEICDILNAARPKPRFGEDYKIPLIYAGNRDAAPWVKDTVSELFDVTVVDNLRPTLYHEVLAPARNAIHDLFMSHVMRRAPGYNKLRSWVHRDVLPTPAAVGRIMELVSHEQGANTLGVDIGGATTDVFSVIDGVFFRSVSANLGMSYSAGNVLVEAGLPNIIRWLPFEMSPPRVAGRILSKLTDPTSLPKTEVDLQIEQAVAVEAIRLAFLQHREIAVSLPTKARVMSTLSTRFFERPGTVSSHNVRLVDTSDVGLLVGSGGALSHAPRRQQAALMLLDGFLPEGRTFLAVDSVFMMPHLGVLSEVDPEGALGVLRKDCLVPLGPVMAASSVGEAGRPALSVDVTSEVGRRSAIVNSGDIKVIPIGVHERARVEVVSMGGASMRGTSKTDFYTEGGVLGLIIDARGRPTRHPEDPGAMARQNAKWARQIGAYGHGGGDLHGT